MKTQPISSGVSTIHNWLTKLTSQFGGRHRQARRRSMRRHQGETLERRDALTLITGADIAGQLVAASDPNDQISEAVNLGTINSTQIDGGSIDNPQDVDMFKVTVAAGQRLAFDVDVTGRFDSLIRLFDSTGREIARNDDASAPGESSSVESYLEYTFLRGGTYYLGVSGYGNSSYNAVTGNGDTDGRTGDYQLTVQPISQTSSTRPVEPPISRFDTEDNNSINRANFIGSYSRGYTSATHYGSTGAGSDTQDWAAFRLDGRTSGTIQISGMTQDLDLELYNSAGTRIARSINSGTRTDTINLNGLAAGTYYVRVAPGVTGARSAYALRLGLTVS